MIRAKKSRAHRRKGGFLVLTRRVDGAGRLAAVEWSFAGVERVVRYDYDSHSRLGQASFGLMNQPPQVSASYHWLPGTRRVERLERPIAGSAQPLAGSFTHDEAGRLEKLEWLRGGTLYGSHEYSFDAAGRRQTETRQDGATLHYAYTPRGELEHVERRRADGSLRPDWTHGYAYDDSGNRATTGIERLHTYDLAGRLLTVTETGRPEAAITNTWDTHGRLMSETSRGLTHSHAYDLAGNRVSTAYSTGRSVTTTHDAHNRPATITEGGRTTTYGYDKAGRAVLMTAGNGQTTNNTYDALGRLTDRTLFQTPAMLETEVLVQLGWDHDAAGNVLAQHETWPGEASRGTGIRSTLMGYDDNYRLLTETIQTRPDAQSQPVTQSTTTYTYNDANNRVTKTVTRHAASSTSAGENDVGHWIFGYNEANQLTSWEKWDEPSGTLQRTAALTYDDNGNRASQTITQVSGQNGSGTHPPAAATGQTLHTWDALDRLTGVETPDGTQHTYTYDHRTRRIGLLQDDGTLAKHTALTFTGGLSTAEWEEEDATPDPINNPPTVEYQRGPDMGGGVGGLLYSLRGGNAKFNLSNGRGDIIAQSDQTAALTWTASYEANGKRTKETGANADKQRGNSKDEDPTGLINGELRYRCLETGVWLSRDPAGFVDGLNLYAHVRQNPWTAFDPNGLELIHPVHAVGRWAVNHHTIQTDYNNRGTIMKWVSDTFGIHSKMHEINNTFLANALVTGDWSVNAVQKIQLTGEQVSKQATITAAIVTTTSAMADKMSKPEPHPNPDNSRRDLTDEEKLKYRRPSSLRPGTRDEIWERSKSQDGTVYDPHTGRPISDGEPWDAGHKPEYKFSEAQKDAAQRGITRKEFLEEQNNPNLYRAERPIINQSHEAEGPPEQFRTGMPSATTPNVPEYENIERK